MRISARTETATPPDLKKSIKLQNQLGGSERGSAPGRGTKFITFTRNPYKTLCFQQKCGIHIPRQKFNWRAGARIETARRRDPGKSIKWRNQMGGSERGWKLRSPFPIPEFNQSIRDVAFIMSRSVVTSTYPGSVKQW